MIYQDMVCGPSVRELTAHGHLVPVEYYAPSKPDLKGLRIRCGDYVEEGLADRMDRPQLVGDIVENWARICPDRKTVVFATGVQHSLHLMERFRDAGVEAAHIDGKTPKPERDAILKRLESGSLQVVTNCMVLTEGWDCPAVSCLILARPTKSLGLYLQMTGRVLRPFPGKNNAIILDHSGAVFEHGFVDAEIEWTLDPGKKIQDSQKEIKAKTPEPITCRECFCVYTGRPDCPQCGWRPKTQSKPLTVYQGNLSQVNRDNSLVPTQASATEKQRFFQELNWVRRDRGCKSRWASSKFKSRFGHWPKRAFELGEPVPPSIETRAWIRSENLKYSRQRCAIAS